MHYCAIGEVENTQTNSVGVPGPNGAGRVDNREQDGPTATGRWAFDSPLATSVTPMQANTPDEATTQTDWQVAVTLRVPRDGSNDLQTDAQRRLSMPDSIHQVEVTDLRGLEPNLAATAVQLEARITSQALTASELESVLGDVPGLRRVDGVSAASVPGLKYGPPP